MRVGRSAYSSYLFSRRAEAGLRSPKGPRLHSCYLLRVGTAMRSRASSRDICSSWASCSSKALALKAPAPEMMISPSPCLSRRWKSQLCHLHDSRTTELMQKLPPRRWQGPAKLSTAALARSALEYETPRHHPPCKCGLGKEEGRRSLLAPRACV
jgi:hypothetical protein